MKTSATVYSSLLVGILFVIIWHFDLFKKVPLFYCEGIGCLGVGIMLAVIGLLLIPFTFGVIGYVCTAEKKMVAAAKSIGISFVVMLAAVLVAGLWNEYDIRKATELNERYVREMNLKIKSN